MTRTPRSPDTRLRARDGLRHRAVLYEANRPARTRKNPPFCLLPHAAQTRPILALHLDAHRGYPPNICRSAAARIRQVNAMFSTYGPLVLVRISMPDLDEYPLHSRTLADGVRAELKVRLDALLYDEAPYTVDIHRGTQEGTHVHLVTPLAFLQEPFHSLVLSARPGPGGGCEWPLLAAHGVLIRSTARDRARVASYVRRHPDGRLWIPGTADYLDALEEELQRKQAGLTFPRLGWDVGVRGLSTK